MSMMPTAILLAVMALSSGADAQLRGGGGGGGVTCPTGQAWGNMGEYCLGGSLYHCTYPGGPAAFMSNCGTGYCQSNVPGVADRCANYNPYPPVPPPRPQPPFPPAPTCSAPVWRPTDMCASFGAYKGQDLANQVCNPTPMVRGGGGSSTDPCHSWQQYECERTFDQHIATCCPQMLGNGHTQQVRSYCRP